MYKNLRIVFTILSAICLAVAIPLGIAFDFPGILCAAIGAGIFFLLMLICKQSQEAAERKQQELLAESSQEENGADEVQTNDAKSQAPKQ